MKASAISNSGLSMRLIAGTHVVLIALDLIEEKRQGCLGFSIQRTMLDSDEQPRTIWLQQLIDGEFVSLERAPLQIFHLEDATVLPAHKYRYKAIARYATSRVTPDDPSVVVEVVTEDPRNPDTAIFFNRGAAGSSAFKAQFGTADLTKLPTERAMSAREWLSNGLEEGLSAFLDQAEGSGSGLHVAVYEIQKPELLARLNAALRRGVEVKIVYHQRQAGDADSPSKENVAALAKAGLASVSVPRAGSPQSALMHNKFVVRLKDRQAEAVWTGSTNWTETAIYGQLNYGQAIYNPEIAKKYEQYFQLIASDPPTGQLKEEITRLALVPNQIPAGFWSFFSPQADEKLLELYGRIVYQSQHLLFACNVFESAYASQLQQSFETQISNPDIAFFHLTGGSRPSPARKLSRSSQEAVAVASATIEGKQPHFSIGARILACDLLGSDPVLVIGSSTFSQKSMGVNDENSLLIRGNTAIADIYFTELMYAFDQSLRETEKSKVAWQGLASDDTWSKPYYEPGSRQALIRRLFAGAPASIRLDEGQKQPPSEEPEVSGVAAESLREYRFSVSAGQIVEDAKNLSKGRKSLSSSRILYALLDYGKDRGGVARQLFDYIEGRPETHYGTVRDAYFSQHEDETHDERPQQLTENTLEIFKSSANLAARLNEMVIHTRHLLAALIAPKMENAGVGRRFKEMKLEVAELRQELLAWIKPYTGDQQIVWADFLAGVEFSQEPQIEEEHDQGPTDTEANYLSLARFAADSPKGCDDLIGISRDVRAFAALIASCSLVPPLSIGLFGEWGSGKTFFMNKLRDEVEKLSLNMQATRKMQRELSFYKHIIQIEFNAWHYMEANIWASLAEHIIKSLAGEEKKPNEAMIELLIDNLKLKQMARQAAERNVTTAQESTRLAAQELEDVSAALQQKREERESLNTLLITRDFLLKELHPLFDELFQKLRLEVTIETGQDCKEALDAAQKVIDQAKPAITPLLYAKDRATRWIMLLAILIAAPLLGLLIRHGISQLGNELVAEVSRWITGVSVLLAGGVGWLRQQTRWLSERVQQVRKIQGEYDRRMREGEQAIMDRLAALQTELSAQTERLKNAEVKKKEAVAREEEARKQLEQATPANLLAGWLHDRAESNDYSKHLGLLAIIRQDFDTLSNMMGWINWRLAPSAPDDAEKLKDSNCKPKYQSYEEEEKEKDTQVSRIVLYIDDLDRCPPEKVVDVLQAVHLLLAFPLFVVVVGVDARWIKQSLKARYRQMLHVDGEGGMEDPEEIYFGRATPDDYLEKIFQIPFWLKPMDQDASWRMIQALLNPPLSQDSKVSETMHQTVETAKTDSPSDRPEYRLLSGQATPEAGEKPAVVPPQAVGEELAGPVVLPAGSGEVENHLPTRETGINSPTAPPEQAGEETVPGHTETAIVELATRSLETSALELKFIERLTPLLGRSPRALKRFANVYRLIKAALPRTELDVFLNPDANDSRPRTNLLDWSSTDAASKARRLGDIADYEAVLFLLAVDTGLPALAVEFFAALEHDDFQKGAADSAGTSVLEVQYAWLMDKVKIQTSGEEQGEIREQHDKFSTWLAVNGPKNPGSFLYGAPDLKPLAWWSKRVARFSFQVYCVEAGGQQPVATEPAKTQTVKKSATQRSKATGQNGAGVTENRRTRTKS